MRASTDDSNDLSLIEISSEDFDDTFDDTWFTEHPSGSVPPPRTKSVPPMGDDDVDPWLR